LEKLCQNLRKAKSGIRKSGKNPKLSGELSARGETARWKGKTLERERTINQNGTPGKISRDGGKENGPA